MLPGRVYREGIGDSVGIGGNQVIMETRKVPPKYLAVSIQPLDSVYPQPLDLAPPAEVAVSLTRLD